MATFYDDFERANGALGGNWVATRGNPTITSGAVSGVSYWSAINTTVSDNHRQEASADVLAPGAGLWSAGPVVCAKSGAVDGYYVGVAYLGGHWYCSIKIDSWSAGTEIAGYEFPSPPPARFTLKIVWEDGALTTYCNGAQIHNVVDNRYSLNTHCGISGYTSSVPLYACTFIAGAAAQFSVTPNPCGNYGVANHMTASGVSTSWTAGTPGSPAFTVDHGTITNQAVQSATSATFDYDPGTFLGTATFTDPSTGLTALVLVSSNPSVVEPPGGGGLSEAVITWLEAQAAHGGLVLADNDTTDGSVSGIQLKGAFGEMLLGSKSSASPNTGYVAVADAVLTIWSILNGGVAHTSQVDVLQSVIDLLADTSDLRARWSTGNPPNEYSVSDVLELLGGVPLTNHAELLTAIQAIQGGDNQEVLDAIAAMQGDPLATIKAVLDLVYALGTVNGYDLGSVKTWVEAGRGSGLPTIRDVLTKLGGNVSSVDTQFSALSALIVSETTIQGIIDLAVAALAGTSGSTIKGVLDAIDDLAQQIGPSSAVVAPVWPGLDNVTLGSPVALADALVIDGPMSGILLTITGQPARYQVYDFGDVNSYARVGQVIFGTDRDDYERSQTFSLDTQIMVPTTMQSAGSAIIRLNEGWSGTVRTWTANV